MLHQQICGFALLLTTIDLVLAIPKQEFKKYVQANRPKVWHNYVQKHLEYKIENFLIYSFMKYKDEEWTRLYWNHPDQKKCDSEYWRFWVSLGFCQYYWQIRQAKSLFHQKYKSMLNFKKSQNIFQTENFMTFLWRLFKSAEVFRQASVSAHNLKPQKYNPFQQPFRSAYPEDAKLASASIFVDFPNNQTVKIPQVWKTHFPACATSSFKLDFALSKKLTLNWTVHSLNIPGSDPNFCDVGMLAFVDRRLEEERVDNVPVFTEEAKKRCGEKSKGRKQRCHGKIFLFCGNMPQFGVFPPFHDVAVYVHFSNCRGIFVLNSSYVVVDQGASLTFKEDYIDITNTDPFSLIFVRTMNEVLAQQLSYLFQVKKADIIVYKGLGPFWLVFDGPDSDVPALQFDKGHKTTNTSTFQSLVQIFTDISSSAGENFSYWSTVSPTLRTLQLSRDGSKSLALPDPECVNRSQCSFLLITVKGYSINVTAVTVSYQGKASATCRNAGLVAQYPNLPNKYTHSNILCKRDEAEASERRSFYSQNSEMFIVLYWYKDLAVMNTTLEVSVSTCKVVNICPCTWNVCHKVARKKYVHSLDSRWAIRPDPIHILMETFLMNYTYDTLEAQCSDYLQQQKHLSNVTLEKLWLYRPGWIILTSFEMAANECVVFDVIRNDSFHERRLAGFNKIGLPTFCRFRLASQSIPEQGTSISYSIRGEIRPLSIHQKMTQVCYEYQECHVSGLSFHGYADRFCYVSQKGSLNCKDRVKSENLSHYDKHNSSIFYYHGVPSHFFQVGKYSIEMQHIFATARTNSPVSPKTFCLIFGSHLTTRSWVEVTIRNAKHDVKTQTFEGLSNPVPMISGVSIGIL